MHFLRISACMLLAAAALAAQPRRIVSTAPSITEMLFALGAGDRVVGVTRFCNYPAAAKKITKIGDYLQPHTEVILGLRPDLIITEDSPLHRDQFNTVGLKTLQVRFESIADIYDSLRKIGEATGTLGPAQQLIASIQHDLEEVRRRVAGRPTVRLMFLVGRTPNTLEGMVAVGNAAYLNEVMAIAGGANAYRDSPMRYFRVSSEQVIARDPAVILDMGDMAETATVTEAHKRAVLELWKQKMPMLSAVQRGRVYAIASDIYVVPGPRVVECAREFARMLHPEVFH